MNTKCPKCYSKNIIKNGFKNRNQRWYCKSCQYNFSKETIPLKSKPYTLKLIAMLLFLSNKGTRSIARLLHVSPTSVTKWTNNLTKNQDNKKQNKNIIFLDKDNILSYCKEKTEKADPMKCLLILELDIVDGSTEIVTLK